MAGSILEARNAVTLLVKQSGKLHIAIADHNRRVKSGYILTMSYVDCTTNTLRKRVNKNHLLYKWVENKDH